MALCTRDPQAHFTIFCLPSYFRHSDFFRSRIRAEGIATLSVESKKPKHWQAENMSVRLRSVVRSCLLLTETDTSIYIDAFQLCLFQADNAIPPYRRLFTVTVAPLID